MTSTIAPGVHRVTDGLVNLYLVESEGRLTVLDTGWRRSWGIVEAAVTGLGRQMSEVAGILLTHGHGDHLGTAEQLRKASGAPVRCGELELSRVRGQSSRPVTMLPRLLPRLLESGTFSFVLQATVKGFLFPGYVQQVSPVTVGESLDLPGGPVPVATPGHTEGHVSYHFPSLGVLVSGDALVTMDPRTRERGPRVATPVLCSDYAQAVQSLDALEPLAGDVVLPGHGDPFHGPIADAVAQARAAAAR